MYTQLQQVWKSHTEKELRAVHSRMMEAVNVLKRSEADVIKCLQEVDEFLVHRFIGYNSLYQYAVQALKLSEHQAHMYITVARKAKLLPRLQEAIENREVTVSKASRVASVINEANQCKWVGLAATLTKRDLEREVARVSPRAATPERVRFLNENLLEMSQPISEEDYKEFEEARDLLSSQKGRSFNREETLRELTRFFLDRMEPVRKAARAQAKLEARQRKGQDTQAQQNTPETPMGSPKNQKRKALPAQVQHALNLRDEGRCQTLMPNGQKCGERRWTEHHHIIPVALGGADELENLVTVCGPHHRQIHAEELSPLRH